MKSEHRHKLKQNELAHQVDDLLQKIQPYWRLIAGGAVVLVTIVFAIGFITKNQRAAQQVGWTEFLEAVAGRNADALSQVAITHAGNSVALWAQHASAQAKLIEACSVVYLDRAEARTGFNSAKEGFEAVLRQTTESLLRQRSLFGLGQVHEGLNELPEAREKYQQLAETWPDSAIGKQAQRRVDSLKMQQTQDFYQWFFAQEPPAPKLPAFGDTPGLPFGQLPSEPDIEVPTFPQSNDLDFDFETTPEDAAETPDLGIFDTPSPDAGEALDSSALENAGADAEKAVDNDAADVETDGAANEN